jgi:hypothetical protein
MSRSLTSAVQTQAAASQQTLVLLAELLFDSGAVRVWTGVGSLSWNSYTWSGTGLLGTVSPPNESVDVRATNIQLRLSGIPSELLSVVLGEQYQGRPATIWQAYLDANGAIVADPFILFQGRMDTCEVHESGSTCSVSISAESHLVSLRRTVERRYTDEDQKEQFAGDRGLEFIAALQTKEVVWGGKSIPSPTTDGGTGTGTGGRVIEDPWLDEEEP